MKYRRDGFYRLLWSEYGWRRISFTWHRTQKGADSIPKAYRYPTDGSGSVGRDYYHHRAAGAAGLAEFAKEAHMRIDWQEGQLVHEEALTRHLCPPDRDERAMTEVLAELDGKLAKTKIKDKRWRCPVCNEPWPLAKAEGRS